MLELIAPYREGVVVDLGTGDGLFVVRSARSNANRFFIGIDSNPRPLEKISEKIYRKPASGGLPNALFVQSALEALPSELDGIASEVHVQFPWGSLLHAVASSDGTGLQNLRRICALGALLQVVIGIDPQRDRSEIQRLGLSSLSLRFIDEVLAPKYRQAGFEVMERKVLSLSDWSNLQTSWAKGLRDANDRTVFQVTARAS